MNRQRIKYVLLAAVALSLPVAAHAATRPDSWITMKAKTALLLADDIPATSINVDTINGRVSLFGKVHSEAQRSQAAAEVSGIEGVVEVKNYLQIVPAANEARVQRTDDVIKADVENALKSDPTLDNSSISVKSVNKGVVLLSGKASSWNDNVSALQTTEKRPGVVRVVSEIEVNDVVADADFRMDTAAKTDPGNRSVGTVMSDLWITSATKMKLAADARTPATEINVDTTGGVVTLFGMVPTQESKSVAQEIARGVSGVKQVENKLEVVAAKQQAKTQARDEDVLAGVRKALKDGGNQDNASIDVEVSNGVVRLTGKVPTWEQSLSAVFSARSVQGVRAVRNDMTVETQQAAR